VSKWISERPDGDVRALSSVLKQNKINGSMLKSLTVEIVRSFGVCYGDAVKLIEEVGAAVGRKDDEDGGIADMMKNMTAPSRVNEDEDEGGGANGEVDDVKGISEMGERLMRERFGGNMIAGIELKGKGSSEAANADIEMTELGGAPDVATLGAADIPKELLEAMPPHIRDIVSRRPDLFAKVQAQNRERDVSKDLESKGMSAVKQAMMKKPDYAQRYAGAQAALDMVAVDIPSGGGAAAKERYRGAPSPDGSDSSRGEEGDDVNLLGI
jgi:hypothetical protein